MTIFTDYDKKFDIWYKEVVEILGIPNMNPDDLFDLLDKLDVYGAHDSGDSPRQFVDSLREEHEFWKKLTGGQNAAK